MLPANSSVFNLLFDLPMTKAREGWKDGRMEERERRVHYIEIEDFILSHSPVLSTLVNQVKASTFVFVCLSGPQFIETSNRTLTVTLGEHDCQSDDTTETKELQYGASSCIQVSLQLFT